jgi:hypothetical protein
MIESDEFTKIDIESNNSVSISELNEPINQQNEAPFILKTLFLYATLFAGSIIYFIFTVVGLVKESYNEQLNQCSNSHLWIYILVNLVVNGLNAILVYYSIYKKQTCTDKENLYVFLGLLAWGCYELFGVRCVENLQSTMLYKILEVNVYFGFVIVGVLFALFYFRH